MASAALAGYAAANVRAAARTTSRIAAVFRTTSRRLTRSPSKLGDRPPAHRPSARTTGSVARRAAARHCSSVGTTWRAVAIRQDEIDHAADRPVDRHLGLRRATEGEATSSSASLMATWSRSWIRGPVPGNIRTERSHPSAAANCEEHLEARLGSASFDRRKRGPARSRTPSRPLPATGRRPRACAASPSRVPRRSSRCVVRSCRWLIVVIAASERNRPQRPLIADRRGIRAGIDRRHRWSHGEGGCRGGLEPKAFAATDRAAHAHSGGGRRTWQRVALAGAARLLTWRIEHLVEMARRFYTRASRGRDQGRSARPVRARGQGLVRGDVRGPDAGPGRGLGGDRRRAEHTLIHAPTGSGKTLAAFLWCLDRLVQRPEPGADAGSSPAPSASSTSAR